MTISKASAHFTFAALILMATLWLIASEARAHEGSHDLDCGGPQIVIEGGRPSPFTLPAQADTTLNLEPDATLTIRGVDMPTDPSMRWGVQGLGSELASKDVDFTSGTAAIDVSDFASHTRGIYEVEGTLLSGPIELCKISFKVNISGFSGTIAIAASGVSAVAGAGALASAPLAANGLSAKLEAKVRVARRRPRGLRRWLPVPAWKRSIFSTLIGAVTGLGLAVVMQQAGVTPLSLASAVWGLVLGGGVSFGVGYSLSVIKTLLSPPEER